MLKAFGVFLCGLATVSFLLGLGMAVFTWPEKTERDAKYLTASGTYQSGLKREIKDLLVYPIVGAIFIVLAKLCFR